MNYRQLIAIILSLTTATASEGASFKNGVYGGLLLGANWGNTTWAGTNTLTSVHNNTAGRIIRNSDAPQANTDLVSFAGRPYLGYQWVGPVIYVSAEVGGTFFNDFHFKEASSRILSDFEDFGDGFFVKQIVTTESKGEASLRGSEFNIDFRPGFTLNRTLVYARGGLAFNTLSIANQSNWLQFLTTNLVEPPVTPPISLEDRSRNSKRVVGTRIGIGTEYLLNDHFGVLLDYVYTRYGSVETHSEGTFTANRVVFELREREFYGVNHPVVVFSTQALMLGLSYHA